MPGFLKQSTAVTIRLGPFLDKTDGVTEETAASPAVEVSKNNGAFAARNSATAITHDSNGWYAVELDATDTGTLGPLIVKSDDSATFLPVWREFMVVPANVYDSLVGGTDTLQTDVTQWLGTAAAAPNTAGVPLVDTAYISGTAQTANDVGADVDAILVDTADMQPRVVAIEVDTSTTLDGKLNDIQGATFDTSTDSLEAIRNRGDAAWTTGSGTGLSALATGTAQGGASSSITLAAGASATADLYKGARVLTTGGTGAGQARLISAYDGTTKVATVQPAWVTTPDATTTYEIQAADATVGAILGDGQSATDLKDFADAGYDPATNQVEGVKLVDTTTTNTDMVSEPPTAAAVADAVWDEATSGHVAAGSFGAEVQAHALSSEISALNDPSAAAIADAVWDEAVAAHTAAGSFGEEVQAHALSTEIAALNDPTAAAIADAVWDEDAADHVAAGSMGEEIQSHSTSAEISALNNLSAGEVWAYDIGDAVSLTAGTAGDRLRKIKWAVANKMEITDATGAVALYKDDGTTSAVSGTPTVTDDSTTTTRDPLYGTT